MMKEIKRKNVIILSILAIIIVLIMGCLIFNFYKERLVKEKKIASLNDTASGMQDNNENEINLILGSYTVQPDEKVLGDIIDLVGDENITFLENNKFNAYKGFGICISGTYTISDNKIDCIADTCYGEYGPNQKISASISFKINNNSELEVIDATESFKIKVVDIPTNSLTNETNDIFLSPFEKGVKFVLSK